MADRCEPLREALRKLQAELADTEKFLVEPEPGEENPPKPVINPVWRNLQNRIALAHTSLRACEESLIPNTPVPVALSLTKFRCIDQSDEVRVLFGINTEDDEPYALVFAVDLAITPPLPIAPGAFNSKMTLIGVLSDVDAGDEFDAPANVIWGLSGEPSLVSSADNLIVVVAMMENDSGSADQARTVLENAGKLALITNAPLYAAKSISRQELVSRIVNQMQGAMGAAKVGVPDPDDNIGPIQELRFQAADLDRIYRNLGPIEKSLEFSGDDARYVLTFRMFR